MATSLPLSGTRGSPSIHEKRWLITFVTAPVEIELIYDARCNSLVLLSEEEEHRIRDRRENVDDRVRVFDLRPPNRISNLFGERSGMFAACDTLLAWATLE